MGFWNETKKKKSEIENEERQALKRNVDVTEHKDELEDLLSKLETSADYGLSTSMVKHKQQIFGPNRLTPPKQVPKWMKFIQELTGFFSLLLWGGAALCFIGYSIDRAADHLYLGIVLIFVVMVTGVFSYYQNSKSESLMNSFKNMLPPKVKVVRDGTNDEIDASQLCPGDIIFVEGGDLIPADCRVLECSDNFHVDNAALTGEAEPQKRKPMCTHDDPLETQNLCFFGTQVPEGSCKALVISIGDHTVMGRIAALAMSTSNDQTPINREIHHFIVIISSIAMFLGVVFFLLNLMIGTPHIENLVFMIGIIVANVPEGLLATVTVCLTLTAQRMHAKKVLVKNLEGVETLGSTSCICSDKTGTLTQNIMTVAQVVYGGETACVTRDAPSSFTGGRKNYDTNNPCFKKLLRCSALCNVATFTESSKWELEDDGVTKKLDNRGNPIPRPFQGYTTQGDGSKLKTVFWNPVGNASECAMIKLVQGEADLGTEGVGDVDMIRKAHPTKFVIPFNSKNKFQVHIHENLEQNSTHLLQMKGAPERILSRCSHICINGKIVPLTNEERKNIENQQEMLSANGLRCLGFAEKELDPLIYNNSYHYEVDSDRYYSANFPLGETLSSETDSNGRTQNPTSTEGLVFLGIMALIDPPRPAVLGAVEKCKTAGVKVIMVTGDHPVTAQAIAYKVGILWSKTRGDMIKDNIKFGRHPGDEDYENPDDAAAIVVPGHEISVDMSEEEWDFILGHPQIVFARTSPQQKLVIVENNQRLGHIVAVTGDGVNDSPAIKKADIGIAMGIMGSEVSKNAADMILLDDNFASIVKGVEEGRLIFDNLKKSIAYTIQSNIPEITPFLAFILFAIPLPLTTFLILAIDLGTDMIPAISMAYELPEADIMKRPPRNSKTDRLVTKKMINFSYGQIGMIQALAGFFTYMVVLNDYGFSPSSLYFRGHTEAWGKQPFYCKFNGGHYKSLDGVINTELDPTVDPPTFEYPFWSEGLDGYIESCGYAMNNYHKSGSPGSDFSFTNSSTYMSGATRGKHTITAESIAANYADGYFKYIPWKAKTSPFWNNKFLYWDADHINGPANYGKNVEQQLYFGGAPWGFWSICGSNKKDEVETKELDMLGTPYGTASIRGMTVPGQPWEVTADRLIMAGEELCEGESNTTKITYGEYDNAIFCNGQSSEKGTFCDKINGWSNEKDNYGKPVNPDQVFYCKDECGRVYDNPPSCDSNGNICTEGELGCSMSCPDVCYSPYDLGEDKWGPGGLNGYKSCMNVASPEVAYNSLKHAQGAFFGSIVVGQIGGLLVCKTRWLSITKQGMRNNFMLFGIGTEFLLVAWLAYCTPINEGLGTRNIRLVHWFCAIPFAIIIFIFDEVRKALMRSTSSETLNPINGQVTRKMGWIERNTAY